MKEWTILISAAAGCVLLAFGNSLGLIGLAPALVMLTTNR
jgi:hypothetical protein